MGPKIWQNVEHRGVFRFWSVRHSLTVSWVRGRNAEWTLKRSVQTWADIKINIMQALAENMKWPPSCNQWLFSVSVRLAMVPCNNQLLLALYKMSNNVKNDIHSSSVFPEAAVNPLVLLSTSQNSAACIPCHPVVAGEIFKCGRQLRFRKIICFSCHFLKAGWVQVWTLCEHKPTLCTWSLCCVHQITRPPLLWLHWHSHSGFLFCWSSV